MTEGAFCADCFRSAQRIVYPCCRRCGVPLDSEAAGGRDIVCTNCSAHPPVWRSARAAFLYDDWSRRLILPLKYSDHTENAAVLARQMIIAGYDILSETTVVVPVPLYRARLRRRKYNQAALLARHIASDRHLRCVVDGLKRVRSTHALARLSPAERRNEMKHAVVMSEKRIGALYGESVLLVDDVLTTGATATACVTALLNAGAKNVDILVAARTGRVDEQGTPFLQE